MSISIKTHKLLWGRSGNRCAICKTELVESQTDTDDPSILGEECHIIANHDGGPRSEPSLPDSDRDKADNLILLCRNHHKIVDDQFEAYTVERLRAIKSEHEKWVAATLEKSPYLEQATLNIAANVDRWAELAAVDNWQRAYDGLLADAIPRLTKERLESLETLRNFLHARFKEPKFDSIERALDIFNLVLNDFLRVFRMYAIESGDWWQTERFYKIREWDPDRYARLHRHYMAHVAISEDLFYEMTRSANLVITSVRRQLQSNYRQTEGVLLVERGPDESLNVITSRPEYEVNDLPYASFESFMRESGRRRFAHPEDDETVEAYMQRFSGHTAT